MWSVIVTQQPSMSTTKLKEGIVGVDWASNQAVIQQFSRTSPGICRFKFPEAWVCTSRQDHCLLAKCGW